MRRQQQNNATTLGKPEGVREGEGEAAQTDRLDRTGAGEEADRQVR